ncbi:metallophosphoesterase family protein [Bizionia myxarmorum]|uniref:Metallophosphoesterase n=1 Tax=Bizionia myxarmorum TaxID=291186 RepID=A0A5D0RF14_9FLAO|nr:metallophosphoesterase family protein [Bizionia myxarmorum]TYB79144.1 metallophosphoesterase [Bizionia myxarmorum]
MDKKIENIGTLSGKVLLFGGVYSNLQALEALKTFAEANEISPENCICTGDIVGYCVQPEETVQLFKSWKAKSIAGNVEMQLVSGADNCGCAFEEGSRCDVLSEQWYEYAQSKISTSSLSFLKDLPEHIQFNYANKQITLVHGSFFNTSEFIFKSTNWDVKQANFEATNSDVIIAGHCGLPFYEENNNKIWINPGVIGMPANNGSPHVWFAILEDTKGQFSFKFHNLDYDFELASQLMQSNKLPESYAQTLKIGIWDNMEILPLTEQKQQGLKINL